ncbi:metallopeptidase family protein [Dehalococcoidia bacterium]|jgi:predicted Zn-dependent protease with MMP-like domain|nr:metallopeptidase family protein [Dehalococcoidia bacterium]|tara:strand:+ start:303 stop:665 length:363 start_codon:yes stop_codon:yes gene_type:complete
MENAEFEKLAREALKQLPEKILQQMDNIDLVVEESATNDQLAYSVVKEGKSLLGLYEGIPLTERDDYGMVLPDKISIFQDSIEAVCTTNEEIVREVRNTVIHEVAHHFGIDDQTLDNIGI